MFLLLFTPVTSSRRVTVFVSHRRGSVVLWVYGSTRLSVKMARFPSSKDLSVPIARADMLAVRHRTADFVVIF